MNIKNSLKSAGLTAAVFAVALAAALSLTPSAKAQGTVTVLNQSQLSAALSGSRFGLTWGSDGNIAASTNGVSVGFNSSPLIAGGASYTSDVWTMLLTVDNGNVAVSASSANAPGLFWNFNYNLSSLAPATEFFFGANYQADNNESLTINLNKANAIPITGTASADASQSFQGFLFNNNGNPVTSEQFQIDINTPSTWERQVNGAPALLATFGILETAPVPEPSSYILAGFGTLALIMKSRKKNKK